MWRLEERLAAAGFQAMIFDGRGMGSSDRRNTDFSLGARMLDLEAVVEAAGIGRFVIAFGGTGATAAATYAGRHRERVSHLVAINPVTAVRDLWEKSPVFRAMRAMEDVAEEEWETFTLMIANSVNDFRDPGTARELADAYRSGMKPADLIAYLRTSLETDPADLFGSIAAPALVVFERTTARERSREVAQRLAQRIPRARFVETDDAARAIADFVGVSGHPAGVAAPSSGMTAILFADIADSTALTERLGDAAFARRPATSTPPSATSSASIPALPSKASSSATASSPSYERSPGDRSRALLRPRRRRSRPSPSPGAARGRRDPRGQQRLRRRGEHRLVYQRPLCAGRGAGVGHGALAGANLGGGRLRGSR